MEFGLYAWRPDGSVDRKLKEGAKALVRQQRHAASVSRKRDGGNRPDAAQESTPHCLIAVVCFSRAHTCVCVGVAVPCVSAGGLLQAAANADERSPGCGGKNGAGRRGVHDRGQAAPRARWL